jgi:hypothetical protein
MLPTTTQPPTSPCPGAAIAGQLLDGSAPVPGATVSLLFASVNAPYRQATTDADGRFRFVNVAAGSYKLRFALPGSLVQYYPGQASPDAATVLTVTGAVEQTVTEQVRAHGSIGGQITTSSGAAVPRAFLRLWGTNNIPVAEVEADANGDYAFGYVPAGQYKLSAAAARYGAPTQWVPDQPNGATATVFTVTDGARTTVDESLLPLGRIFGSFSENGETLPWTSVEAVSTVDGTRTIADTTYPDGGFRFWLYPGTYQLHFFPPDGRVDQWWHGKDSQADADVITVRADVTVTANETALPMGRAVGYVYTPGGVDYGAFAVVLTEVNTGKEYQITATAGTMWAVNVRPGTYVVRYETQYQTQWGYGKTSLAAADRIVVGAGGDTVIEETLLPLGELRVTARDAVSGQPVDAFCAEIQGAGHYDSACTTTGTVSVQAGEGHYKVTVDDQTHLVGSVADVWVPRGGVGTASVALKRAADIVVRVVDARTGAQVDNVCVNTWPVGRPRYFAEGNFGCTDGSGQFTIARVLPDRYTLFAAAYDGTHGAQWVGPTGGVGSQGAAKVFTLRGGVTTNVTIRLDGAGSVSGVVTDRATGRPVGGVAVQAGGTGTETDATGRYTLDGLGPYSWQLLFAHPDYASQWTGGGTNRLTAPGVRIRTGQTARSDAALRTGTVITGLASGPGGVVPEWATVSAVNADTYDTMAAVSLDADGRYRLHVAGPQQVKIYFDGSVEGSWVQRWYPGVADFSAGRTLSIPPSATTITANLTVTP